MEKEETPELRFTEEEAAFVKKIAAIKLQGFEKEDNAGEEIESSKIDEEIESVNDIPGLKIGEKLPEYYIKIIELSFIEIDKGRKLLEHDPNFIFGKAGSEHVHMIYEIYTNLSASTKMKNDNIARNVCGKLGLLLDRFPEPSSLPIRIYKGL